MTTPIMKIVKLLECSEPEIVKQFQGYSKMLKIRLSSVEVENCKIVVENYIKANLEDCLVQYKLYSYKFFDSIKVEILLKPLDTANIIEYHLIIEPDNCRIERVR